MRGAGQAAIGIFEPLRGRRRLDLAKAAVDLARRHEELAIVRGSVGDLPFVKNSFDLVTSFDVLYHRAVGDDAAAVKEVARVLRPDGWFLLRLPAFEFLRSNHDRVVHTERRYRAAQVRGLVEGARLRVRRLTYANSFIRAALKRVWERTRPHDEPRSDVQATPTLVNKALTGVLNLGSTLLRNWDLPVGVSVCCWPRNRKQSKWAAYRPGKESGRSLNGPESTHSKPKMRCCSTLSNAFDRLKIQSVQ
jgi:SAM-dependent methyltransferase